MRNLKDIFLFKLSTYISTHLPNRVKKWTNEIPVMVLRKTPMIIWNCIVKILTDFSHHYNTGLVSKDTIPSPSYKFQRNLIAPGAICCVLSAVPCQWVYLLSILLQSTYTTNHSRLLTFHEARNTLELQNKDRQ